MIETVTNKTLEKLKYDLVREGLVSYETIEKAQELANAQNINIGQALINSNVIDEETLLKFLENKLHIPSVDLDDYTLDKNCLQYINVIDARKYKIIPLFKIENTLTVAMADPLDLFAIDKIMEKAECNIEPIISTETSILKIIDEYYKTPNTVGEIYTETTESGYDWHEELNNNEDLSDEHIQKIIRAILKQAILENKHEVYFAHTDDGLEITFKDKGAVYEKGFIPSVLTTSFVSKLKTLSNLDPSVSEIPQLGKLSFKVDDMILVASISSFPTVMGERIALKIYKPPVEFNSIIKDELKVQFIKNSLEKSGIILVCGAPLSGKTHVIYSLLNEIAKDKKNIMTIESVTKYDLPKINQCELNESIGFNLDKALRFIEFQSPQIIYIEGMMSKYDYISSLVFSNKTIITEFLAENMSELREKMAYSEVETFKSLVNCLIFIHSKDSIEVFDKSTIQKYLA
ncbi:Flp pilus assembly complex ATPase component TadA [bacterium]|nr:Flp pilus assembly complex ATPase component TadA [bacterium]